MKKSFQSIIIILLVLVIVLLSYNLYQSKSLLKDYNNSNNIKENNTNNNNGNDNNNNEYVGKSNDELREFQLEINYGSNEVEFDYEVHGNSFEAEYKNELTNERVYGEEAKKIYEDNLKEIDFSAPQSQVVDMILNNLGLKEDFDQFEIEVEYNDNSKIEFKINN